MLKMKNANPAGNGIDNPMQVQQRHLDGQRNAPMYEQQQKSSNGHKNLSVHEQQISETIVTTNWETFDFDFNPVLVSNSTSTSSTTNNSVHPKFSWEFFE